MYNFNIKTIQLYKANKISHGTLTLQGNKDTHIKTHVKTKNCPTGQASSK